MPEAMVKARWPAWRPVVLVTAAMLLVAPAIAMQFTSEVSWGPGDFLVFGGLLAAVCLAFEAVVRLTQRRAFRIAGVFAILAVFLLVWAELAVGVW